MFKDQSQSVTWHIEHRFYEEMSRKSEIVSVFFFKVTSSEKHVQTSTCYTYILGSSRCDPKK